MTNALSITIVVLLLIVLFTLVDPFMYWMPSETQMIALTVAAGLLVIWVAFVVRENGEDEREMQHRMNAGRAAYLSGILVLAAALVVQGFSHTIDPWIPLTLSIMFADKMTTRLYTDRFH